MSFQFRNDSGETIPPYAVMKHVSTEKVDHEPLLIMDKPSGELHRLWYINGPASVRDGDFGLCHHNMGEDYLENPVLVSGSPTVGKQYGPSPSQWYIAAGGLGFDVKSESVNHGGGINTVYARQREVTMLDCINTASSAGSLSSSIAAVLSVGSSTVNFTLAVYPSHIDGGEIAVNSELVAIWLDKWRIIGRGCNDA